LSPSSSGWQWQAFRLQTLKEASTTEGFIAALEVLIATPDADQAAVVQAALKCKREHKVRATRAAMAVHVCVCVGTLEDRLLGTGTYLGS